MNLWLYVQSHQDVGANTRCPQCDKPVKYAEPNRFTDAGAEALHADRVGCSIFLRISSQTDLTSAVITDACSMRSKISFASSRYFCAVSWT